MLPLIVTAAVIKNDGKYLVTRRLPDARHPLLWEFPGGKLEPSEDPVTCIVREIEEELAIQIQVERVFDVLYHRYPERAVLILAYECSYTGGVIQDRQVAEHRWVVPEEMAALEFLPADVPLVEKIRKEDSENINCLYHQDRIR